MPHRAFAHTSHRPWRCPARPWFFRQSWRDLLFAHWPVPASVLRPLVPRELEVQERDGTSWVGVVPFRMADVAPRFVPAVPGLSAFPELNLRLYVEKDGKPGVWFLSLDAASSFAVWGARRFFHLPYFKARISMFEGADGIAYESERLTTVHRARFSAVYGPTGEVYEAAPGTLEHWLTERYCLYAQTPAGELRRTEVHHVQWPLQPAAATFHENHLAEPHGFELAGEPALLHFARRIDVVAWAPEKLAAP